MTTSELREGAREVAPTLFAAAEELVREWSAGVLSKLNALEGDSRVAAPKTFTDPVLGPIDLFEWEVFLLDSAIVQRLRGIRQLGMAHLVYPAAGHDRFGHTIGVIEVADRMLAALHKNASYHAKYGLRPDESVDEPDESDRFTVRLAALLHDIGHAPFSHASEELLELRNKQELNAFNNLLRKAFEGATGVKPSEAFAILMILSESFGKIFLHPRFRIPVAAKENLPVAISALIIGARCDYFHAPYLYTIVSGPLDADKLDYMARDSYFSGLPIGLDVDRLVQKLEIVTISADDTKDPSLLQRIERSKHGKIYEMGISMAGLTAYEQMIVGRVLLYDRVYYHHKVRSGEAMIRSLYDTSENERGETFSIRELYSAISDDSMIHVLGGRLTLKDMAGGQEQAQQLADRIHSRRLFHRSFAFAERFIAGIDKLDQKDQQDTRASLWKEIITAFSSPENCREVESSIVDIANALRESVPDIKSRFGEITKLDVIVDLPDERSPVGVRTLPMRSEGGRVISTNLFFDQEKWSDAFKNRKQCGFVFAPKKLRPLVWLASQIVFFEKFGLTMRPEAHNICKTENLFEDFAGEWLREAVEKGVCSSEAADVFNNPSPRLKLLKADNLEIPEGWKSDSPDMVEKLVDGFYLALPGGLVVSVFESFNTALNHFFRMIEAFDSVGKFKSDKKPNEVGDLQAAIRESFTTAGISCTEGAKLAGGESDLILSEDIVVENKVIEESGDPMSEKIEAGWQSRRYSMSLNKRIGFVVLAYKPKTENQIPIFSKRVSIGPLEDCDESRAIVKILIPWGSGVPSRAKPPSKP